MQIGATIRYARKTAGLAQKVICNDIYISDTHLSDIERGERPIQPDTLRLVTNRLDNAQLYLAAAEEVTGGVFATCWLDGENVDLHPAAIADKLFEEIDEVIQVLQNRERGIRPVVTPDTQEQETLNLIELVDLRCAIDHYIAIRCEQYKISPRVLFERHRDKLEKAGYKRKSRPTRGGN